jgi:phage gp29-like protein
MGLFNNLQGIQAANLQATKKRIALAKSGRPGGRVTVINSQGEPYSQLDYMDADRMSMICRAAIYGNTRWLFSVYRDMVMTCAHLQTELNKRKLAVLGDLMRVAPFDKTLPDDVAAAAFCKAQLGALSSRQIKLEEGGRVVTMTSWLRACGHALDAVLWPVSVLEKVFAPADGRAGYDLQELVPVPHYLLDFSQGYLRIELCDDSGRPMGDFIDPDPERYIVHRGHLLSAPDNFGGPMRSLVWLWLLSTMTLEWWSRFLDRFGSPFLVGKYEQSDDQGRRILENAFGLAVRIGGLVVSRETEIEIKDSAAKGEAGYGVFVSHCHSEMSKLILGQTLSATPHGTGMGSGVANLQRDVRDDFRKFDAIMLAETLRDQLLVQLCEINNIPGNAPKPIWGQESPDELTATGTMLKAFSDAGLEVDDGGIEVLSERAGLPLRRKAAAPPPVQPAVALSALSAALPGATLDAPAVSGADAFAQAVRGQRARIAQLIRESTSADDCLEKIKAFTAHMDVGRQSEILEQTMAAYAGNALLASKVSSPSRV